MSNSNNNHQKKKKKKKNTGGIGLLFGSILHRSKEDEDTKNKSKKNQPLAVQAYAASHSGDAAKLGISTKADAPGRPKKDSSTTATPTTITTTASKTRSSAPTASLNTISKETKSITPDSSSNVASSKWSLWKRSDKNDDSKTNKTRNVKNKTATHPSPPRRRRVGNFLTRTRMFQDMLEWAFEEVDADGSGQVDPQELYSGLLLIHLKLGSSLGPAACKPISREQTQRLFQKVDVDHSGTLDRQEFDAVMMVLFGNALLRVAFQYSCTIVLVPLLAQQLLTLVIYAVTTCYTLILQTLDNHSDHEIVQYVQHSLSVFWNNTWHTLTYTIHYITPLPTRLDNIVQTMHGYMQNIPPSVWNSIPLTVTSTILSMMIIPWSLMRIDDYFPHLAERKKLKQGRQEEALEATLAVSKSAKSNTKTK